MDVTLCYADLAGYSALSEAGGNEAAAEIAVRFTDLVDAALGGRDRLLRTVGDAAVVACADAEAGVLFASTLWEAVAGEPDIPGVRAALHHGPANAGRRGPLDGATNPAARLLGCANRGQALATQAVAEAAERVSVEATRLGDFELPGIAAPVTVFELDVSASEGSYVEDPVCRTEIERERAPARLRYNRAQHYFCSLACAGDFARDPDRYVRR